MTMPRATVVAIGRDNRVLLVMERGSGRLSLPGGAVRHDESSIAAAARELYQKTGLNSSRIEWRFEYRSRHNRHQVFLAVPRGRVKFGEDSQERHLWWDGVTGIRFRPSSIEILRRVGWLNWEVLGLPSSPTGWRQLGPPHKIPGVP